MDVNSCSLRPGNGNERCAHLSLSKSAKLISALNTYFYFHHNPADLYSVVRVTKLVTSFTESGKQTQPPSHKLRPTKIVDVKRRKRKQVQPSYFDHAPFALRSQPGN